MSYDALVQEFGKTAVQFVELYLDKCSLTYGVAPCTAVLGTTGAARCFNTFNTCQDQEDYARVTKIYRFSTTRMDNLQQPGDAPTFPTLLSVQSAPTVLTPGQGLGVRSSLSITIQDHPWTDAGIDPYVAQRSYDPDKVGTFWGRFIKRNRYYQNRRIDVLTGFLNADGTYDVANFKRRTYIIQTISGPNPNGTVTITAKDPLKLADGEKAKWPRVTRAVLHTAVNTSATSIVIDDPDMDITTWYTDGGRYIRIENEIMHATSITDSGTVQPTLTVARATMPSEYNFALNVVDNHDVNATIQPCWFYDGMVYDIVYHLLATVAGIDPTYLPYADWKAEIDNGFQYLSFSALLTDPVDVKTLLTEITQLNVLIWWHERDSVVKLKGLRFRELIGAQITDDTSIIAESTSVTEDTSGLVTEAWTYFDIGWPLANPDLLWSYRVVDLRANLDREEAEQYGYPAIRSLKTRWLHRADAGTVAEIGTTTMRQYQDVRKVVSWEMDPKDDRFWVGDTVGVATKYIQDEFGNPLPLNVLVTQVQEVFGDSGVKLQYVGLELFSFLRVGVITHPDNSGSDPIPAPDDYGSATPLEKDEWAYICYNPAMSLVTEEFYPSPLLLEDGTTELWTEGTDTPKFLDGTGAYQII